jgi:restriction system protein
MARRKPRKRSGGGLGTLLVAALIVLILTPEYRPLALILLGVVLVVVWLLWRRSRPKTPTAQELTARFEAVSTMSGGQFEIFVADLFRAMGHQTTVMGGSGDQGVDLIVRYEGQQVAVQCKNYKKRVGNKPVQEVYAGARHHRCNLAWVVAPAGYTKGAFELARSVGVSLYDADAIRTWIRRVDQTEKERERAKTLQSSSSRQKISSTPGNEVVRETSQRAVWHPHPDDPL